MLTDETLDEIETHQHSPTAAVSPPPDPIHDLLAEFVSTHEIELSLKDAPNSPYPIITIHTLRERTKQTVEIRHEPKGTNRFYIKITQPTEDPTKYTCESLDRALEKAYSLTKTSN